METIDYSTKRGRSIYALILVLILACGIVKLSLSQRAKRDGAYGRNHTQEYVYIGTDSELESNKSANSSNTQDGCGNRHCHIDFTLRR